MRSYFYIVLLYFIILCLFRFFFFVFRFKEFSDYSEFPVIFYLQHPGFFPLKIPQFLSFLFFSISPVFPVIFIIFVFLPPTHHHYFHPSLQLSQTVCSNFTNSFVFINLSAFTIASVSTTLTVLNIFFPLFYPVLVSKYPRHGGNIE